MKYALILLLTSCTQHIHNKDLLKIQVGMNYDQVVQRIGEPYSIYSSTNKTAITTAAPYFKETLNEVFIYRTHSETSSYFRSCFLVYTDKVLKKIKC